MPNKLAVANAHVNSYGSCKNGLAVANIQTMEPMNEIYRRRRWFLRSLVEAEKVHGRGAQQRVADRLSMDSSHLSQVLTGHRQCGEDLAAKICNALHKPIGWMDQDHTAGAVGAGAESNKEAVKLSPDELDRARALLKRASPASQEKLRGILRKADSGQLNDRDIEALYQMAERLAEKGKEG